MERIPTNLLKTWEHVNCGAPDFSAAPAGICTCLLAAVPGLKASALDEPRLPGRKSS